MVLLNKGVPALLINGSAIGALIGNVFALPARAVYISWQTGYTGSPSAVNVVLEVSNDNLVWNIIDTATDAAGELRNVSGLVSAGFIRARMVSNTGGTLISVSILVKN